MKKYFPLLVIVLVSIIAGAAMLLSGSKLLKDSLMINVSGIFFLFLATLKFWDLKGFYHSFAQYDLLAKRSAFYGYLYPFLELLIALCYLARFFIVGIAILTVILMAITLIGVIIAVLTKKDIRCACMGTKLDIPLSAVSLVETLGMGAMSLLILLHNL